MWAEGDMDLLKEIFSRFVSTTPVAALADPKRLCRPCFNRNIRAHALFFRFREAGDCASCEKTIEPQDSVAVG
jgi:hypothetical protein